MTINSVAVKETPYQSRMTWRLAEQWGDGIQKYSKRNPQNPEWMPTPLVSFDFSDNGYGLVHVKNEAVNPTGTIKDRAVMGRRVDSSR